LLHTRSLPSATPRSHTHWLILGVVLTALIAVVGTVTSVPTDAPILGAPNAAAAQATSPVGQATSPRLQPVGNGDTISSPVDPTDDASGTDSSWWWRVVFGAAVVVVVLVALIQRRQVPDSAQGIGRGQRGPARHKDDRNALGH